MPDSFILMEVLRRSGIDFEFFTTTVNEMPRLVCRLFLPDYMAKYRLSVFSGNVNPDSCIIDFLEYIFVTCAQ